MNAYSLNSNPFLIEPINSDVEEINNENKLLYPYDDQNGFMNIEDKYIDTSEVKEEITSF